MRRRTQWMPGASPASADAGRDARGTADPLLAGSLVEQPRGAAGRTSTGPAGALPSRRGVTLAVVVIAGLIGASGLLAWQGLWPSRSAPAAAPQPEAGTASEPATASSGDRDAPPSARPVALMALPVARAVDAGGNLLALDPRDPVLDLPLMRVTSPRSEALWGRRLLARDLGTVAVALPDVFAAISEARLGDEHAVLLVSDPGVRVLYDPPITPARLREGIVALNAAAARRAPAAPQEIDLRFSGQIVVRTAGGTP